MPEESPNQTGLTHKSLFTAFVHVLQYSVLTLGILFCVLLVWLSATNPFDDFLFSSDTWLDSRGEDRAGMAEDLIDHHIVAGMSRDEIHSLLGAPSETYTSPHYSMRSVPESKRTLAYWIGHWPIHGYDSTMIYVHFDDRNRVISGRIGGY